MCDVALLDDCEICLGQPIGLPERQQISQPTSEWFVRQLRSMTPEQLKTRTKAFAVAIVRFARHLPTDPVTIIMTR